MKGYPPWFSPRVKPRPPSKPIPPKETITQPIRGKQISVSEEDVLDLDSIKTLVGNQVQIEVELDSDAYEHYATVESITIFSCEVQEVPNLSYNKDLALYKKYLASYKQNYAVYKERLAEWSSLKARYDKQLAEETKKKELQQLERLLKKYPNDTTDSK